MPDNYYSEVNENGVVTPLRDLAAFPRSEQAVLGAKNINGTKYVSQTSASVVWTANDDGSITAVSGTATDNNSDIGVGVNDTFVAPFTAQVKILGGLTGEIYLFPYDHTDGARPYKDATKTTRLTSSDNQWGDTPLEFYMIEGHKYVIAGRVVINTTVNNDTMYPRLLLATDTDPTYAPFVMTNRELTEQLNAIFAESLNDGTTFNIPYKRKSNSRNTSGLIVLSGGLYHYFIHPSEQSNTVDVNKILDVNTSRSATATFADDVLTVTFNATVPGGITLLTGNRA